MQPPGKAPPRARVEQLDGRAEHPGAVQQERAGRPAGSHPSGGHWHHDLGGVDASHRDWSNHSLSNTTWKWVVVSLLLWIVAFPLYLAQRGRVPAKR